MRNRREMGESGSDAMEGNRGGNCWWAVAAVGGMGGGDEGRVAAVERWMARVREDEGGCR
jgi:hypothetical protein